MTACMYRDIHTLQPYIIYKQISKYRKEKVPELNALSLTPVMKILSRIRQLTET